jgi:hypothetical protein
VDQVLARALHKEPQERYPTTRSFFEALDEACGSSGRTGVSIASALFWAWA